MELASKVILSFIVGGAYVSGIVWAAERLGARIGGAIAGIPSTLLVSLVFISISSGAAATKSASSIVPVLIVAALFYGYVFVRIAEKVEVAHKHLSASLVATLSWLVFSLAALEVFSNVIFTLTMLAGAIGILIFYLLFRSFPTIKPKQQSTAKNVYTTRFVIAGSVVSCAVLLARLLGPTWGGLAASFPATVASSLYFLNKSQSCKFTKGFVRKLPTSFISTYIFIIILHLTLTRIGAIYSFIVAMLGALVYTVGLIMLKQNRKLKF